MATCNRCGYEPPISASRVLMGNLAFAAIAFFAVWFASNVTADSSFWANFLDAYWWINFILGCLASVVALGSIVVLCIKDWS